MFQEQKLPDIGGGDIDRHVPLKVNIGGDTSPCFIGIDATVSGPAIGCEISAFYFIPCLW